MPDQPPLKWPLRPSQAASAVHGLCLALSDLVHEDVADRVPRRVLLKVCGLATAAELLSGDVAHWFASRMGEEQDWLDWLEERYLEGEG